MADQIDTATTIGSALPRVTVVSCWLCGINLHKQQMIPDGSSVCADIRWYCKDTKACTDRWTTLRPPVQVAGAA